MLLRPSFFFLILCLQQSASSQTPAIQGSSENSSADTTISGLKLLFSLVDSTGPFNLNEVSFFVDDNDALVRVIRRQGDHPGRVSGHLIDQTTYHFADGVLIAVEESTFDFKRLLRSQKFDLVKPGQAKISRRARKYHMKQAAMFLDQYRNFVSSKRD